jgi:hypothetical protein
MVTGYVHVEVEVAQSSKKLEAPCGDVVACDRNAAATTLICADGIGSGIRAHIAAEMCASRLVQLLRLGHSLRKAFSSVARTMQEARDPSRPFAAFSVARILNDGMTTVLCYDAPPAVLVSRRHAAALPQTPMELDGVLVQESNCYLEPGDAVLLMSDGITQAGLGSGLTLGWQTEGVVRYVNDRLTDGLLPKEIPQAVHREAVRLWTRPKPESFRRPGKSAYPGSVAPAAPPRKQTAGDDCTVMMALCRRGHIVNILTGPPAKKGDDVQVVRRFMQMEGLKFVCGGTTAELVGHALRQTVMVEQDCKSLIAPPRYEIPGVDLVTEGAVTLNQVYNLLDEDIRRLTEDSGVTELCALLQVADRVNIFVGGARNVATDDISFRQRGILNRHQIIPLIAEKLRAAGKLVVIENV